MLPFRPMRYIVHCGVLLDRQSVKDYSRSSWDWPGVNCWLTVALIPKNWVCADLDSAKDYKPTHIVSLTIFDSAACLSTGATTFLEFPDPHGTSICKLNSVVCNSFRVCVVWFFSCIQGLWGEVGKSFPICAFLLFFKTDISLCPLFPFFYDKDQLAEVKQAETIQFNQRDYSFNEPALLSAYCQNREPTSIPL